jgi:hypothetical protein
MAGSGPVEYSDNTAGGAALDVDMGFATVTYYIDNNSICGASDVGLTLAKGSGSGRIKKVKLNE